MEAMKQQRAHRPVAPVTPTRAAAGSRGMPGRRKPVLGYCVERPTVAIEEPPSGGRERATERGECERSGRPRAGDVDHRDEEERGQDAHREHERAMPAEGQGRQDRGQEVDDRDAVLRVLVVDQHVAPVADVVSGAEGEVLMARERLEGTSHASSASLWGDQDAQREATHVDPAGACAKAPRRRAAADGEQQEARGRSRRARTRRKAGRWRLPKERGLRRPPPHAIAQRPRVRRRATSAGPGQRRQQHEGIAGSRRDTGLRVGRARQREARRTGTRSAGARPRSGHASAPGASTVLSNQDAPSAAERHDSAKTANHQIASSVSPCGVMATPRRTRRRLRPARASPRASRRRRGALREPDRGPEAPGTCPSRRGARLGRAPEWIRRSHPLSTVLRPGGRLPRSHCLDALATTRRLPRSTQPHERRRRRVAQGSRGALRSRLPGRSTS